MSKRWAGSPEDRVTPPPEGRSERGQEGGLVCGFTGTYAGGRARGWAHAHAQVRVVQREEAGWTPASLYPQPMSSRSMSGDAGGPPHLREDSQRCRHISRSLQPLSNTVVLSSRATSATCEALAVH